MKAVGFARVLRAFPPFLMLSPNFSGFRVVGVALLLAATGDAAPFQVNASSELRADGTLLWSGFSTVDGAAVPNFVSVGTTRTDTQFTVVGGEPTSMTIWNPGGAPGAGAMLANSGPGGVYLFSSRALQGIGVVIGHQAGVSATYQLDYFGEGGVYLGSVSAQSPGGAGQAVFLGVVDPTARIWIVGLHAAPGNALVLSNPVFQVPPASTDDPASLPVAGQATWEVSPTETYLHEGLRSTGATAATTNAVVDNSNAHDLRSDFPTIRAGDLLRFERRGLSIQGGQINPVLAVFTRSPEIREGTAFRRLPTALEAGRDFYTAETGNGAFPTATNIPEDFVIGESTFVSVPADARYVMTSLARPSREAGPIGVKVSHVPRRVFEAWLAGQGLHGPNAALDRDLDGDGLSLLEEFAFQKDPTVADARPDLNFAFAPKLGQPGPGGRIALVFGGRLNAPLRYTAEFSADLITWQSVPASAVTPLLTDGAKDRALFEVLDTMTGPRRFGRIRIEYLPPVE